MRTRRISLIFVVVLVALFAVQARTQAQGGPSLKEFTLSPGGSTQVGQKVNIHIEVNASTYGAAKITVTCGGVTKIETSELKFDSTWDTNGCNSGVQTVTVCTKTAQDEQWMNANCMTQQYTLTGNPPAGPSADFWADTNTLSPGQCTTMHWRTSGATLVNIDGENVGPNGDRQICPRVTKKYSLRASGSGVDATRNFSVEVGSINRQQPGNPQSSNPQPQPGGPNISQAQQPGGQGGFDLITVAYAWGYGGVHNEGGRWDGWIMDGNGKPPRRLTMNDFELICQQVYGSNFHAFRQGEKEGDIKCRQGGSGGQGNNTVPNPPNPSGCGSSPSRLKPGDIAVVSNFDPYPLKVYHERDIRQGVKFTVPVGEKVSIIQGPSCAHGVTWVEVGYQGNSGWAIEVSAKGYYNLILNGMPLPGPKGEDSTSSNPQVPGDAPASQYPVAQGLGGAPASGSYIYVPTQSYNLYLRTSPVIDSSRQNVIGTMKTGDYYQVVEVRQNWIRVQTSVGEGWVFARYVQLTNQSVQQQAQPTQVPPTPVPPAQQPPQAAGSDPCEETVAYGNSDGIVLLAYAADQPQCASYVRGKYSVFFDCLWNAGWHRTLDKGAENTDQWAGASNTAVWARIAPNCSLTVKQGNDPSLDLNNLASTEWLMVWSPGCEDTGSVGHIGIYLGQYDYQKQEVYIDESNWDVNKYPPGPRRRPLPRKDLGCITFIHVGLPPGNKQTGGNNQQGGQQQPPNQGQPEQQGDMRSSVTAANAASGLCIFCTPRYWIQFHLPSWSYELNNYRLTFLGNNIPWESTQSSVWFGTDTLTFVISSATVQGLIDNGYGDKLSDKSSWRLYYIAK